MDRRYLRFELHKDDCAVDILVLRQVNARGNEINAMKEEINAMKKQMNALPPNKSAQSERISRSIDTLRAEITALRTKPTTIDGSTIDGSDYEFSCGSEEIPLDTKVSTLVEKGYGSNVAMAITVLHTGENCLPLPFAQF